MEARDGRRVDLGTDVAAGDGVLLATYDAPPRQRADIQPVECDKLRIGERRRGAQLARAERGERKRLGRQERLYGSEALRQRDRAHEPDPLDPVARPRGHSGRVLERTRDEAIAFAFDQTGHASSCPRLHGSAMPGGGSVWGGCSLSRHGRPRSGAVVPGLAGAAACSAAWMAVTSTAMTTVEQGCQTDPLLNARHDTAPAGPRTRCLDRGDLWVVALGQSPSTLTMRRMMMPC